MAGGTAIAQAITILFTPIITRLFPPEAYGSLGTFSSLIVILTPLVAMTYPMAIVLASNETEVTLLKKLSILIAITFSLGVLLIAYLFEENILVYLNLSESEGLPYLLALTLFFAGCAQVFRSELMRARNFSNIAKLEVANSLINNAAKASLGLFLPISAVLIGLYSAGQGVQAALYRLGTKKNASNVGLNSSLRLSELIPVAKRYSDFAIYRAPQGFLNAVSQSLPILILGLVFSQSVVGYYVLAKSILSAPITLVGKSVSDVFYPRIVEGVANNENVSRFIARSTIILFVVALLPFTLIFLYGPVIFQIAFGEQWAEAGSYAGWLSIWFIFGFINRPAVVAVAPLKLQSFFLKYEVISIVTKGTSLIFGIFVLENPESTVAVFSLMGAVLNLFLVFYVIKKSKRYGFV
jgi:O-antigen/teichoic acid export membrane protein